MASRELTFELPEDVIRLVGSPDATATKARTALVLELLREATISQGRAARLLGITRGELLDLMRDHRIPSGPETAEEARREIEEARRHLLRPRPHASG